MKNLSRLKYKKNGFSLIEILVAVVISSIGLLSLGVFQSNLLKTSAESKARIEGGVLCQAEIEKFREYTFFTDPDGNIIESKLTSDRWFNPDMDAATAGIQTSITIPGNNADYLITRTATVLAGTETADGTVTDVAGTNVLALDIDKTNAIKEINLNLLCSWTDSNNSAQSITLDSIITFNKPSSVAIYNIRKIENDIPAPTGRAHLGEGTLTKDEVEGDTRTADHDDGTSVYKKGDDLVLIDDINEDGSANIVLTLERACETDNGICTDFVEIHGRIYRNISSDIKNKFDTTLLFDNLFIKASDAAYCKKWTLDGDDEVSTIPKEININDDGQSDYDYMNYTCYLGGGWYGNIGLLIGGYDGIKTDYKMCMGDPNYADKDGYYSGDTVKDQKVREEYKYTQPSLAVRRAYRGMKYKLIDISDTDTPNWQPELEDQLLDESLTNPKRYYSVGIKDASKLYNQDFVLIENNTLDATDCFEVADDVRPLIRSDSENYRYPVGGVASPNPKLKQGLLFANNPGDFVCLNNYIDFDKSDNGYVATVTTEDGDGNITTAYSVEKTPIQFDGSLRAAYATGIDIDSVATTFEDTSDDIFDYEQLYAISTPLHYISEDATAVWLARNVDLDFDGDVNFKDVNMTRDHAGMLPPPLDLHMGNINDLSSTLIDDTFNPPAYLAENTVASARDGYKYRADTECPFDPTHPTITYDIPGTLTPLAGLTSADILIKSSTTASCPGPIVTTTAKYPYSCSVYASILPNAQGNLEPEDWTGTISAYVLDGAGAIDNAYVCSPSPTSVIASPGDTVGTTVVGVVDTTVVESVDITCGKALTISGTILKSTAADDNNLTLTMSGGSACTVSGLLSGIPDISLVDNFTGTDIDGYYTYSCTSNFFESDNDDDGELDWNGGDISVVTSKNEMTCSTIVAGSDEAFTDGSDNAIAIFGNQDNQTIYSYAPGLTDSFTKDMIILPEDTTNVCPSPTKPITITAISP